MASKVVWNVLLFGALIGAALFMYAEQVKQTFVNHYEASNLRQETVLTIRKFFIFYVFFSRSIQLQKKMIRALN